MGIFQCKKRTMLMLAVFILTLLPLPAIAASETPQQEISLSLEQAIIRALNNSDSVKKAGAEVERSEEMRDYRAKQLDYLPTAPAYTAVVEVPWARLLSADLEWRMSKKGLTAQEDSVAIDTCQKYWAILKAQQKLQSAELADRAALRQLQNAQAGSRVGTLAPIGLIGAESQYQSARSAFMAAANELEKAYIEFNQLVGLASAARPVLSDSLEFSELTIDSLDYEVARVLDNAPQVWQAEQMVELQGYLADMTLYTGEYQPYKARQIEKDKAIYNAAATRKLFESNTRSLYYLCKNLEQSHAALQEGIKVAEENLRIKKIMFDLGMITASDLAAEEKSLAEARSKAFELTCTHAYMKLAFQKPWAANASAMSSN